MLREVGYRLFLIFVFTALLSVSCGPQAPAATQAPATEGPTEAATEAPPAAWIYWITNDPAYPSEDGVITFTINYRNPNSPDSEEVLTSPILEVFYDQDLTYCQSGETCQSRPEPTENLPNDFYLRYEFEELSPEESNAVIVSFTVKEIPHEISLAAKLSGTTTGGSSIDDNASIVIQQDGMVRITYSDGVEDIYPEEGVSVWLPHQDSGNVIHSEKGDLGSESTDILRGTYLQSIIHLDVNDENNERVNTFAPSIIFSAVIPEELKDEAQAGELVLLLYDSALEQWIPCDGEIDSTLGTQCEETIITEDGRARINIKSWTSGAGWGVR